jgi:hypothetical protein
MTECFECGAPAAHQHPLIPRRLSGTKTVPLCEACHDKVHGRRRLVFKIEPVPPPAKPKSKRPGDDGPDARRHRGSGGPGRSET